jgi:hypothetical protein
MGKFNAIVEAPRTEYADLTDLLAAIEAEERRDGLCPDRAWCFAKRLQVSKHAMAWHKCAFEQHHVLHQCHESGNGHERVLDWGIMARCAGATFCGDASCDHAKAHRWDPLAGCHAVKCRKLAAVLENWDKSTKGPLPDIDVVVTCEQT